MDVDKSQYHVTPLRKEDNKNETLISANMHFTSVKKYHRKLNSQSDRISLEHNIQFLFPGNHWTWEIVHMLLTGKSELTEVDMKSHQLVHLQPADLDSLPSPRVLDTHRQFQDLPTDFVIKKRKLVLVVRDPRDICVSMYHFIVDTKARSEYQGTFGGFLSLFLQGKGKGKGNLLL